LDLSDPEALPNKVRNHGLELFSQFDSHPKKKKRVRAEDGFSKKTTHETFNAEVSL
jgi:hypothetical protein